jgi:ERCC4-type nuclease
LPSIDHYKIFYKSYTYACSEIGVSPLFADKLPIDFQYKTGLEDMIIITDTREQEPLFFKKQVVSKLDVGDYGIQENFDYTFVDRKSEQDFKSTLSPSNLNRFRRELDRCRSIDCYVFIVVESKLETLEESNKKSFHKSNMKYIFHNMRVLQHEYKDCCQFVFSGGRKQSETLIPMILRSGKKIWNVDLQYHINKIKL